MLKLALGLGRYALFIFGTKILLSSVSAIARHLLTITGQYHGSCPAFSNVTVKCRF